MKPFLLLAIAISSCWLTAASAASAEVPALPPDAELRSWIVGNWRVLYSRQESAAHYGYETYRENGTYRQVSEIQEGSAGAKLLFDVSGTWKVEHGYLVVRITGGNVSTNIGRVRRGKVESASRDWFIVSERGISRTRRRARLPVELVAGAAQAPKVFSVEEAAQVLRYAVKPE